MFNDKDEYQLVQVMNGDSIVFSGLLRNDIRVSIPINVDDKLQKHVVLFLWLDYVINVCNW